MITEAIVKEKLDSSTSGGVYCNFIKLDEKWALKLYDRKTVRDFAFKEQSRAAVGGFAPEVGETVDFENLKMYGYVTEIIETYCPSQKEFPKGKGYYAFLAEVMEERGWKEFNNITKEFPEEFKEAVAFYNKIEIDLDDAHL